MQCCNFITMPKGNTSDRSDHSNRLSRYWAMWHPLCFQIRIVGFPNLHYMGTSVVYSMTNVFLFLRNNIFVCVRDCGTAGLRDYETGGPFPSQFPIKPKNSKNKTKYLFTIQPFAIKLLNQNWYVFARTTMLYIILYTLY